jgi:hypothetical protein
MTDPPDPTDPTGNEDALFKSALGPTAGCPRPELLVSAAGNPDVQRHLENCSRCRTELAMLLEFEKAEPRPDELASVQWIQSELRRRSPELTAAVPAVFPQPGSIWERLHPWVGYLWSPRGRGMLLVAASLLVMVTAGVYLRQGGDAQRPSTSAGGAEVWRSGQFVVVSPVGDVAQSPSEFRWEAVPRATTYQIRLMEVDGAVIWSSDVTQTSVEIPHNVRSKLTPGRAFQWEVVARSAAGERIASTVLQKFHILPNSR